MDIQMTHSVAAGTNTKRSLSAVSPLRVGAENTSDDAKAVARQPSFKRNAGAGTDDHSARRELSPGVGPRPGSLDKALVVDRDPAARPGVRADEAAATPDGGRLRNAAMAAFREEVLNEKRRAFIYPGRVAVIAAWNFFQRLRHPRA